MTIQSDEFDGLPEDDEAFFDAVDDESDDEADDETYDEAHGEADDEAVPPTTGQDYKSVLRGVRQARAYTPSGPIRLTFSGSVVNESTLRAALDRVKQDIARNGRAISQVGQRSRVSARKQARRLTAMQASEKKTATRVRKLTAEVNNISQLNMMQLLMGDQIKDNNMLLVMMMMGGLGGAGGGVGGNNSMMNVLLLSTLLKK